MTNSKQTKKALLMSVLSIAICFAMLIGTTFAWFTDSVTSGNNRIAAGNLEVDLLMYKDGAYTSIANENGDIFKAAGVAKNASDTLWEPGKTQVAYLAIENKGSLDLKYKVALEVTGVTKNLNEVMQYVITPDAEQGDIKDWDGTNAKTASLGLQTVSNGEGQLKAKEKHYFALSVHMMESAGNTYQGGTIDFDLTVLATQLASEFDSFDNQYDVKADYDGEISNAASLASAFANGGAYKVISDIVLDSTAKVPAGVTVDLDLGENNLTGSVEVSNSAALTLANGSVKNTNSAVSGIQNNGGTLILNDVNITSARHALRVEGGKVTINGGVYKTSATQGMTQHALNVSDGGYVTVNNGTFVGPKGTVSDSGAAVNVQTDSTVIINGGSFSNGKNNTIANKGTLIVRGGSFDQDPSAYIADGYTATQKDGAYTVSMTQASLTDALNKAESGDTITMPAGTYTLPSLADKEGVTIEGVDGTVIGGQNKSTGFGSDFGKDTTIKNITFSGSTNGVRYSYAKGGNTTFENCTFKGDSTYGFHIDQSNGATFTFNDCTFIGFNAFAGDLVKVVFNDCDFLSNGNYGHTNIWSVGEFNDCTWGDNTSVGPRDSGKLYFNGVEESYHHEFVGSAESLVAFAEAVNVGKDAWTGQKVLLVADIDLSGIDWKPIGQTGATEFKGVFDGQGYTIKNLQIDSSAQTGGNYSSALFGWIESHGNQNITIKNVNVNGATVSGHHNVAVIAGYLEGSAVIENCHVTNAKLVNTHANDDACGDKSGALAGYAAGEVTVKNCSATDSTVTGGRDAGQLIGASYVTPVDCSATNVTVSATGDCTGANINNALVGRKLN